MSRSKESFEVITDANEQARAVRFNPKNFSPDALYGMLRWRASGAVRKEIVVWKDGWGIAIQPESLRESRFLPGEEKSDSVGRYLDAMQDADRITIRAPQKSSSGSVDNGRNRE